MCLSWFDWLPDSAEAPENMADNSWSDNPSSNPASTNRKVPTNFSSEGNAFGFQTTLEGPLERDGSKSASNDLCARAEAKAELMYQLGFELEDSSPAIERAC